MTSTASQFVVLIERRRFDSAVLRFLWSLLLVGALAWQGVILDEGIVRSGSGETGGGSANDSSLPGDP